MGELFGKVVERHPELALIAHSARKASTLNGKAGIFEWNDYVSKLDQASHVHDDEDNDK